jgi:hypothetical protein
MHKDLMTHGMHLPNALLRTCVVVGETPYLYSCLMLNEQNLLNILNVCGFSPEDVTSITQADPIKLTITVTSSVPRKILGKSGAM